MRRMPSPAGGSPRVALFVSCITDTFFPRVGLAVARLLRHFGCDVHVPPGQTCCGQPAHNGGFREEAAGVARRLVDVFAGAPAVVTPSASCAVMVRRHVPELLADDARRAAAARALAQRTWEFSGYLRDVLGVRLEDHLRWTAPVTFHHACHAREIDSAADVAARLAACGADHLRPADPPELCCGFGGTFAVDFAEVSGAMLREKLAVLAASGARVVVCDEGGCALQLIGGARRAGLPLRFAHVAELLAERLGLLEPAE
jgi:L-lactate dehydrogenase complex protein LldE